MYNKTTKAIDLQIMVEGYENYCLMADITLSHVENNKFLIQLNNNFENQDLQIEAVQCSHQLLNEQSIEEYDPDDEPIVNDDGQVIRVFTIHKDILLTLRRNDGYIKFTCPTYQGREVVISWVYKNEGWLVEDFCKNKHNIIYKD